MYHNSSVWLDTLDASNWDRNPADFTSVGYLTVKISCFSASAKEFYVYIYLRIGLSATKVLSSLEELPIYAYVGAGNSPLECLTQVAGGGKRKYQYFKN